MQINDLYMEMIRIAKYPDIQNVRIFCESLIFRDLAQVAKLDAERLEAERIEAERLEAERLEKERQEAERLAEEAAAEMARKEVP